MAQFLNYDSQFLILDSRFVDTKHYPSLYITHSPNNPLKYESERQFVMEHAIEHPKEEYLPLYEKYRTEINWTNLFMAMNPDDDWAQELFINYSTNLNWQLVVEYFHCFGYQWALELIIQHSTHMLTDYEHEEDYIEKSFPIMLARPDLLDWNLMMMRPLKEYFPIFEKYPERMIWNQLRILPYMRNFVRKHWKLINFNNIELFDIYSNNRDWILQFLFIRASQLNDTTWNKLISADWAWPLFREYPERFISNQINLANLDIDTLYEKHGFKKIVFAYDYEQIKRVKIDLNNQVIGYFYHPLKIQKWIDAGHDIDVEDYDHLQ